MGESEHVETSDAGLAVPGYSVGERLGAGGFGEVFAARHAVIGRDAAIKVLHAKYSSDAEAVARFVAEARAVGRLSHPGIVDLFELGALPDGRQYFVMERIRGRTLREVLAERTRLPLVEALPILRGIAEAVDAAHAAGIAHRDLKPDNVFVVDGDKVKLIDFGLAKLTHEADRVPVTETGSVFGTPLYMSPEQCRGKAVTLATDAYSFGVLAYHVLTGVTPFAGEPIELALHHLNDDPEPPSTHHADLDGRVDRVIAALMAKDPAQRPSPLAPTIAALAGEASLPPAPRARRSIAPWMALGALVVAAGGAGGVLLTRDARPVAAGPRCPSGAELVGGIWDPLVKATVQARFVTSDQPFVRDFGLRAFEVTDLIAADLRASQDAYCREEPSADPLLHAQRADCIAERIRGLKYGSESFLRDDVRTLTLEVSDNTMPIGECLDDRIVRAQPPPLRDAEAREAELAAVVEVETAVHKPGVTDEDFAAAEKRIEAGAARVEAMKSPETMRMKLLHASFVRSRRRDFERSRTMLDEVVKGAERTRDDHVLVDALHLQIESHLQDAASEGRVAYAADEVARLLERQAVAVERSGTRVAPRAQLLRDRAAHAWQIGDFGEAVKLADEHVAFMEQHVGPVTVEAAAAYALRADYASRKSDHAAQLAAETKVREIRSALLGPRHPRTLTWGYLAALQATGKIDAAIDEATRMAPWLSEALGPQSRELTRHLDWLGHLQTGAGRLDEAIATYNDVIARMTAANPGDSAVGWQHFKLGTALLFRGRVLDGLEQLLTAERVHARTIGIDHVENVRGPRPLLIEVMLAVGRFAEARARLATLEALLAQDKLDPQLKQQLNQNVRLLHEVVVAESGDGAGAVRRLRPMLAACADPGCTAFARQVLSQVLMKIGRPAEASEHLTRVVDHIRQERQRQPRSQTIRSMLISVTTSLASAKLAAGEAGEARVLIEGIEQDLTHNPGDLPRPEAYFVLARALVATKGDRARAIALARMAVAEYEPFGDGKLSERRAVERWLAAHAR